MLTEAERLRLIWYIGQDMRNLSLTQLEEYGSLLEERLKDIEEEERRDREAPTGLSVDNS
jgi:hypothetical protein